MITSNTLQFIIIVIIVDLDLRWVIYPFPLLTDVRGGIYHISTDCNPIGAEGRGPCEAHLLFFVVRPLRR